MQERYYAASPYNLVRIILGKAEPDDNEQQSVYSRAAANLRAWRASRVVAQDHEPSIYLYIQTLKIPGDGSGGGWSAVGSSPQGSWRPTTRKSSSGTNRR